MTIFREAVQQDIREIQIVRNSVTENMLSDPNLVPDKDVDEYITKRGKGWVAEADSRVVGFTIADLQGHNIWALFILPEYEGRGIGKELHRLMLDWYFSNTKETVWLSTAPASRADSFYRKAGWRESGTYGKGETRFEMTFEEWRKMNQLKKV